MSGNGTMFWAESKQKYTGQWKDGLPNGLGICIWYDLTKQSRGLRNRYIGQWKNGMREGYGKFFYTNGTSYEGFWRNNQKTGFGIFTFQNGEVYIGKFYEDKMTDFCFDGIFDINENILNISNSKSTTPLSLINNTFFSKNQNTKDQSQIKDISKKMTSSMDENTKQSDEINISKKDIKNSLPQINNKNLFKKESLKAIPEEGESIKNNKTNKSIDKKLPKLENKNQNTKKSIALNSKNKEEEKLNNESKKNSTSKMIIKERKITDKSSLNEQSEKTPIQSATSVLSNKKKKKVEVKEKLLKGHIFIATDIIQKEHNKIQLTNLIDFSDLLENEENIQSFSTQMENVLQRISKDVKLIFNKLIKWEYGNTGIENHFNKLDIDEENNPNTELNETFISRDNNDITHIDATKYLKDNSIGTCLEMKKVWKYFRENDIINYDFSIAEFNRLFYKSKKNLSEMFIIPEEIPARNQCEYIYTIIKKAMKKFNDKYEEQILQICEDDYHFKSQLVNDSYLKNQFNFLKKKPLSNRNLNNNDSEIIDEEKEIIEDYFDEENVTLTQEYCQFNPHYPKNVLQLNQFYDVFVRLAYLRSYCTSSSSNSDAPLFEKIKNIFDILSPNRVARTTWKQKKTNKSRETNLYDSGVFEEGTKFESKRLEKKSEIVLIESFMIKYNVRLNNIFQQIYYLYTEKNNIPQNYNDMTITNRFILYNIVKKGKILCDILGTKEKYFNYISHFHKDKKKVEKKKENINDEGGFYFVFANNKEKFDFFEQVLDLEMISYEFSEFIYIAALMHSTNLNKLNSDGSIPEKNIEDIITEIKNIIDKDKNLSMAYKIKYAIYNYEYPIKDIHIQREKEINEEIEKEHKLLIQRYMDNSEEARWVRERKMMAIEEVENVFEYHFESEDNENEDNESDIED